MDASCFVLSRFRKLVSPVCKTLIAFLKTEVISFKKKEQPCHSLRTAAGARGEKFAHRGAFAADSCYFMIPVFSFFSYLVSLKF
jgi:hypothetical protein